MDSFTFEDLFGEDMALTEMPKEKKVKEKKPAGNKPAGKAKAKGTDFDVAIPCQIFARGWTKTIEGTGTMKVSEVFQMLYDEGYLEVKMSKVNAVYSGDRLYIVSAVSASMEDTAADFSSGAITICDGQLHCEVTPDDFDGYDADEISASMLLDKFLEQNPEYTGCRISLEGNIAVPVFTAAIPDNEIIQPCMLKFSGEEISLDEAKTCSDIITEHYGDIPNVRVHLYANLDKTVVFADFSSTKPVAIKKPFEAAIVSITKVEQKFKLPLHVRITTWNGEYDLSSEDFSGKEKVTEDDIKEYFKPRYKIFSDTSRKLDLVYIEEENLLSLMFISGEKGYYMLTDTQLADNCSYGPYELLRNKKALNEAVQKDTFHGNYVEGRSSLRVENLAHGLFMADIVSETGKLVNLCFMRKLPKMPPSIMEGIITCFREDLTREAWMKVCYNKTSGEYFLVKGKPDHVNKTHINFSMPADGIIDNRNILQVMEVHSHNTMPAIFSSTDDADEIYPGLYAVVGKLDTDCPDIRVRAGMEGVFCEVPLDSIMEMGV